MAPSPLRPRDAQNASNPTSCKIAPSFEAGVGTAVFFWGGSAGFGAAAFFLGATARAPALFWLGVGIALLLEGSAASGSDNFADDGVGTAARDLRLTGVATNSSPDCGSPPGFPLLLGGVGTEAGFTLMGGVRLETAGGVGVATGSVGLNVIEPSVGSPGFFRVGVGMAFFFDIDDGAPSSFDGAGAGTGAAAATCFTVGGVSVVRSS